MEEQRIIMKISGLQKVSFVDFDGHICATIFTSGCNFACPYCHNSSLVQGNDTQIPETEIIEYLEKRKNVLDSVCISGGEPTLNHDLPEFISKIKNIGYKIKLDTNGSNLEMLKHLIENKLIDYVAMDIKNCEKKYNLTINKNLSFSPVETINYIMSSGLDYEFRTTLVDGFHSHEDITQISEMIKGANKIFLQKFEDSGNCLKSGLSHIPVDIANEYKQILSKTVKHVYLRGY